MTRRTLMESGAALLLRAAGAQPPNNRNRQVFQHDLPKVSLDNSAVTAIEVAYGPGERKRSAQPSGSCRSSRARG